MKFQDSAYNCGVYALYNALEAVGVVKAPEELAGLAGTTPQDGTDAPGLLSALKKLGRKPDGFSVTESAEARAWAVLVYYLAHEGRPVILAVDYDEATQDAAHWVVARALLGERVLVADSAHPALEPSYTRGELMHRWNTRGRSAFYGVAI